MKLRPSQLKKGIKDYNKVSSKVDKVIDKWDIFRHLDDNGIFGARDGMIEKGLEDLGYTPEQVGQIVDASI